jgi:1-acyl-sn-glycerol-3-phosphate acyltransferase
VLFIYYLYIIWVRTARRLVSVPAVFGLALLSVAAAPLWIPALALADRLRPPPRAALRVGALATLYLHLEVAGVASAFALWLLHGWRRASRDRYLESNFRLQCWWASTLFRTSSRIFDLSVEVEAHEEARQTPLLLFPRHASLADTLLPAVFVSSAFGTRLRWVMKRELLWDPCLDIVGQRLPNHFVDRFSEDSAREVRAVGDLAEGLGPGEGVLIFPEGTRFTAARRRRILARLREEGDPARVARAERLEHLLPPRTGGPIALLERSPETDVVFCAHTGFEAAATLGQLWSGALVGARVRIRFWRVPAADIPGTREGRIEWLLQWWERLDAWLKDAPSPGRSGTGSGGNRCWTLSTGASRSRSDREPPR